MGCGCGKKRVQKVNNSKKQVKKVNKGKGKKTDKRKKRLISIKAIKNTYSKT